MAPLRLFIATSTDQNWLAPAVKWVFDPRSNTLRIDDDPPVPDVSPNNLTRVAVAIESRIHYLQTVPDKNQPFVWFPTRDGSLDVTQVIDPGPGQPDLAVGGNETVFLIGAWQRIFEFDRRTATFVLRFADPIYAEVSVDPEGLPWAIDVDARVRRFEGKKDAWALVAGGRHWAIDLDVGPGGEVFIVDTANRLLRYNATNDDFDRVSGVGPAYQVAVDADAPPWVQVGLDPPAFTSFALFRARFF